MHSTSIFPPLQALSAQEDLQKAKEELKNAAIVVQAPLARHVENEHDEHDESHAEASAELSNEGVSHLDLRSEEERVTEAQKNQRVKQQLQVRVWAVMVAAAKPRILLQIRDIKGRLSPPVRTPLFFQSLNKPTSHTHSSFLP